MRVIKRDGRIEDFNSLKIESALIRANRNSNNPIDERAITVAYKNIIKEIRGLKKKEIAIEEIQDIIVKYLDTHYGDLGKNYEDYRKKRATIRDAKVNGTYYKTIMELIDNVSNDTSKENSNKDATQIHVIRDLVAGETSKKLYREIVMPTMLKELHDKGVIHVHDCDYRLQKGITNCELTNLEDVLQKGTMMNDIKIDPPKSLRTACTLASQVITNVSSNTYGGQTISISHLAPFVEVSRRKIYSSLKKLHPNRFSFVPFFGKYWEKKLEKKITKETDYWLNKEIKESIQTLLYQLNTIYSSNGQSPFITLFLYPDENPQYKEETMVLCKEILRQRILGMKGKNGEYISPTFPKLVTVLTETMLDKEHSDYEFSKLCAECVSKRMVPDFLSEKKIKEFKEGNVIPPMGKCKCSSCKI